MVHLRVLGALEITAQDGAAIETIARQPRRAALLAFLTLSRPRGLHRRDSLVAMFWPESDSAHARQALNQALHVLRTSLGAEAILARGQEEVGVDPRVVTSDAAAFEDALDRGDPVTALALFHGPLLNGLHIGGAAEFERWLDGERERLTRRAADGAWDLAQQHATRGDPLGAAEWARHASALLPVDEGVARRLITFLHALGDRAAALRAYDDFVTRLRKEYELEPSAPTVQLLQALREQPAPHVATASPLSVAPPDPSPAASSGQPRRRGKPLLLAAAALGLLGVVGWLGWRTTSGSPRQPATDSRAYTFYLRGRDYFTAGLSPQTSRIAVEMFEHAIALDSNFALAYAGLAQAHAQIYWFYFDRTPERRALARAAARRALELDPRLPEAHLAMGYVHYWGYLSFDSALAHYREAQRLGLDAAELYAAVAVVERRQGKLEAALADFVNAMVRDPRASNTAFELANTYGLMGDKANAARYYDRALLLSPQNIRANWQKARLHLGASPSFPDARRALVSAVQEDSVIVFHLAWIDALEGRFADAQARLSRTTASIMEYQWRYLARASLEAAMYERMGQRRRARALHESARALLDSAMHAHPEDPNLHSALALAYASLGQRDSALLHARQGVELLPLTRDAWRGLFRVEDVARVHALLGDTATALDSLQSLFRRPGGRHLPIMELASPWDGFRRHPRYLAIVR